jgi:hypothetical protein
MEIGPNLATGQIVQQLAVKVPRLEIDPVTTQVQNSKVWNAQEIQQTIKTVRVQHAQVFSKKNVTIFKKMNRHLVKKTSKKSLQIKIKIS